MTLSALPTRQGDAHLWLIALGLSLLLNSALIGFFGFTSLKAQIFQKTNSEPPALTKETIMVIFPNRTVVTSRPIPINPASHQIGFARTSEDQTTAAPQHPQSIGERNTQATSDRLADPTAPPLPSQSGINPRNPQNLETTASTYQDGNLANQSISPKSTEAPASLSSTNTDPAFAANTYIDEKTETPKTDDPHSTSSTRETLFEGSNPVDISTLTSHDLEIKPKATSHEQLKQTNPTSEISDSPKPTPLKPKPPKPMTEPGFRGYRQKTAIVGSISRTGRSALDVADSPLGRYQAIISRAIEQEWQRNCVRHRDFITPGFLTIRFFVEANGHIRTVQFVGDMETGEVQKGFTLNSIRDANIPAMPANLKKNYEKEPLELIFNFYF